MNTQNMTMNVATETKAPMLQEYNRKPDVEKKLTVNPNKTIMLLLQGVVDKGNLAKVCHQSNALVEKGFHLGRMTTILDALRDRLNLTNKMPITYDLEELYRYADKSIQEAVFERDTFYLDSALEILTELRDAWSDMMNQSGQLSDNS